ncbi:MAG: hypothetical protein LBB78_03265 [Spirochaetaceae bacterium]|jgi:hypothetical protein|nr:hypothetical protein [Spirochaetaceae bacterium]
MWNYFEPEEARWYHWNLNGAAFYLRRDGNEWRAVVNSIVLPEATPLAGGPGTDPPPKELPGYFIAASNRKVILRPYFYEKPYYINFREKICLMPEAETRLNLALPPVLRLEAGELELIRFTPFLLSEAWTGDNPMSGSLCVSLPMGSPSSEFKEVSSFIHGELILRNPTKTVLAIDHLVLYTNSLNIYEKEGRLLCETAMVDTNGGEPRVNFLQGVPGGYGTITSAKKTGWGISLSAGIWI